MFIDNKTVTDRVEDEDNLVNLVLSIASRKSRVIDSIPTESDATPDEIEVVIPEVIGEVRKHHPGKPEGRLNIPFELKHLAGILAQTDTTREVGKALGMSQHAVAQYAKGQSSPGVPNPELKSKLDESLSQVRDKAFERLLSSLDLLDDEKIKKATARDISAISANMSKVVGNTLPKDTETNVRAQLIVYAPTQINENKFEVVEI
jgi:predicted transcriptional regulator